MNEFSDERMVQRLRSLEPRVNATELVRRVLSAGAGERTPSRRPRLVFATVLLPLALVLVAAVASFYAPVFAEAVADAPIVGRISGPVLRSVGLAGAPQRVSAFGDRATSAGYEVELVGGYADSGRTVLFLHATPAARVLAPIAAGRSLSLNDQFGQSYRLTGGIANSETGENTLVFEPLRWPATWLGARLHLSFNTVEFGIPPAATAAAGQWQLSGTLAVDEGRDLPTPTPGTIGEMQVSFTHVRALPVGLLAELRIDPGSLDLNRIVPDGLKGRSAFTVKLIDDTDRERPLLQAQSGSSSGSVVGNWLWQIDGPGRYELRISYEGVGIITREIVIQ